MKKIILIAALIAAGIMISGCNNNGTRQEPAQPVPPVVAPPVAPPVAPVVPDPEPTVPDVGTGSVNYQPSCTSGFAKIIYVFRTESTIDTNSFVVVHSVDGESQDIKNGSVYSNGSISKMEETIYISPNDSDVQKAHQINVSFISDGISQVNSFAFLQPPCEVEEPEEPEENNETAVSMTVDIK